MTKVLEKKKKKENEEKKKNKQEAYTHTNDVNMVDGTVKGKIACRNNIIAFCLLRKPEVVSRNTLSSIKTSTEESLVTRY